MLEIANWDALFNIFHGRVRGKVSDRERIWWWKLLYLPAWIERVILCTYWDTFRLCDSDLIIISHHGTELFETEVAHPVQFVASPHLGKLKTQIRDIYLGWKFAFHFFLSAKRRGNVSRCREIETGLWRRKNSVHSINLPEIINGTRSEDPYHRKFTYSILSLPVVWICWDDLLQPGCCSFQGD